MVHIAYIHRFQRSGHGQPLKVRILFRITQYPSPPPVGALWGFMITLR